MKTLLLLTLLLMITTYSNAYYSRTVPKDTIPDTAQVKPLTGSGASTLSAISGIGSFIFNSITGFMLIFGTIYNWGALFPIGCAIAIGLVGIISGNRGLSIYKKMLQTNLTVEGKQKAKRIKRRSITGIIFGIIGIGIPVILKVILSTGEAGELIFH